MNARHTSLASLFIIVAILFVAGQTRRLSPETQFQMQEDHIDAVDKISQQNKAMLEAVMAREAQTELDLATYRGAILGFGGLLSVLQIVGLIRKRNQ